MKCKKEQLILISVIVLLAGYLLAQKGGRTHYALPQLPKIEKKEITKLSLKEGGRLDHRAAGISRGQERR
jgi:hypothetical protein